MPCSDCKNWQPRPKKTFGACPEIEKQKLGRNELGRFIFAANFECRLYEKKENQ